MFFLFIEIWFAHYWPSGKVLLFGKWLTSHCTIDLVAHNIRMHYHSWTSTLLWRTFISCGVTLAEKSHRVDKTSIVIKSSPNSERFSYKSFKSFHQSGSDNNSRLCDYIIVMIKRATNGFLIVTIYQPKYILPKMELLNIKT